MASRPIWDVQRSARGLDVRWVVLTCSAWVAVMAFDAVTAPLLFPYEARGQMVDSGLVVGLVLPIALGSRVLDEGSPHLLATASRPLVIHRLAWAASYVALCGLAGVCVSWGTAAATRLVLADSVLLSGAAVIGAALLGASAAWVLPFCVATAFSAPGLVPWTGNLLYRQSAEGMTLLVALVVAVTGLAAYAGRGPTGRPE